MRIIPKLSVLIGTSILPLAAYAQQKPASPPASSAPSKPPAPAKQTSDDDDTADIVVTGRALPGSVIGDIKPEHQLTPRDIASYGVGTISELLDQIALLTGSAQGDGAPIILVNGRRVSGVNEVGDLPTESVLRIDILPEEVALKYGYAADQKVVNVILRRRFRSLVFNAGGSMSTAGGAESESGDATITRIHDNDRINIAIRAKTGAALFEDQRGIAPDAGTSFDSIGNIVAPHGGEIDPGLSAFAGAPVTIAGVPGSPAMPSLAGFAARAGQPNITDDTGYRTLRPSTRDYSINAVFAHAFSRTVTTSFTLQAERSTSLSKQGLPSGTLLLPAGNPYSPFSEPVDVARYFGGTPLDQRSGTTSLHGGATINADLTAKWRLSVIGGYDHSEANTDVARGYDLTAYQAALDADDPTVSPYGPTLSMLLGNLLFNYSRSRSDAGNASALLTGPLFKIPAGPLRVSLRVGGTTSSTSAATDGAMPVPELALARSTGDVMASLDIPIASKTFLHALGTLTASVNVSRTDVSHFDTLQGYGYGLNWSPVKAVALIVAMSGSQHAPTLQQLDSPTISTANVRVYDYATGTTATVTRLSGGNPALTADDRRQFKAGGTFTPFPKINLTITANYVDSRVRNPIGSFPGASASLEAAFPDRFTRDAGGQLIGFDARPVNFSQQEERQLRWGFDFIKVLRQPKRPAGFGRWRRPTQPAAPPPDGAASPPGDTPPDANADTAAPNPTNPDGSPGDIVVTGNRNTDAGATARSGFGRRRGEGFGRGGFGGRGGRGGFGGQGGGRGGGGGFGGRGGGGGAALDNSARLEITVYHSWIFADTVQISPGMPQVDLLHGGTLGGGAQPAHRIEFNAGISDNGIGWRLTGQWQSAASVTGSAAAGSNNGTLHFSSLATASLRGFVNLQQRLPKSKWARGVRVTLALTNLFDSHQKVTDALGQTPIAYLPAYADPLGRTVALSIRKLF
jgi:uncharacterized membrane protein YgcG